MCRISSTLACALFLALSSLSAPAQSGPSGTWTTDVAGNIVRVGGESGLEPVALVFIGTECPISNKYIQTLNALSETAKKSGVGFYGVISTPHTSRAEVASHAAEFKITFPMIFDASGDLAAQLKPTNVPQAFVVSMTNTVVYRGRIDDQYADLGKPKAKVTRHDLRDAIVAVAAGKAPEVAETEAIGCVFEAWDGEAAAPTWNRDIAPLVRSRCTRCHQDGEVAPFPLLTYEDAKRRTRMIAKVVEKHYMPPWKPAKDFGHFRNDIRMTDAEVSRMVAWARGGAPRGEAGDEPPADTAPISGTGWQHDGKPDLVLKLDRPYSVPASGRDIYRYFVMKTELPEDTHIVAFQYKAGATSVVHHAVIYLDPHHRGRKRDARDEAPGYKGFGSPGFSPSGILGAWAPGSFPNVLPPGVGQLLPADCDLVVETHYHPNGKEHEDAGTLALWFAKKPCEKLIGVEFWHSFSINIPAGDKAWKKDVTLELPVDTTLLGAIPHMHLLGKEMKVSAVLPDGTKKDLIWIDDWDFRWQSDYTFAAPIELPKGTVLRLQASYDNSEDNPYNPNSPPKRVRMGESTADEMCLVILKAICKNAEDARTLQKHVRRAPMRERYSRRRRRGN